MIEAGSLLGFFSAILLVAAVAIWANWLKGPALQRLDGRLASNSGTAEAASRLIVIAGFVSVVAAATAIVGLIRP